MSDLPPIYIINLKRTPERKLHMQRELDALNLPYQFVDAIDKHDLHCPDYRRTLARQNNIDENVITLICESMRIGAAACALSHIKVYNLMIENNISVACILEDDGHLLPTFPDVLAASNEVSWDVLMFSHQSKFVRKSSKALYQNLWKSEIFPKLYKIMFYKKFYPHLNFYTVYLTLIGIAKYTAIHYLNKLKKPFVEHRDDMREDLNKSSKKFAKHRNDMRRDLNKSPKKFAKHRGDMRRDSNKSPKKFAKHRNDILQGMGTYAYLQYHACQQGAIPSRDKSFQLKSTSDHYIAQPEKIVGNHPTSAIGYMLTRSAAIKWKHQFIFRPCPIDTIPSHLYEKENLNLYMVVPPCIMPASNYLFYSSRHK